MAMGQHSFQREAPRPQSAPEPRVKIRMTQDHYINSPGFYAAHTRAGDVLEVPAPTAKQLLALGVAELVDPMQRTAMFPNQRSRPGIYGRV